MNTKSTSVNLENLSPQQILVQKTGIGKTESYLGSVTLEWLASRVDFAGKLSLFSGNLDPKTDNIIRNSSTVEEINQRPLDWSRQILLTQYLILQKNPKFPPLLVVVSPSWVEDELSSGWDSQGKAIASEIEFSSLNGYGDIGILNLTESLPIFALDGQHRLMGIKGLMELIQTGKLTQYTKDKTPTGSVITLEYLEEFYHIDSHFVKSLAQEKIGIEFIPAVVKGETREQAKRRIRSVFVHINLTAVPLSKGHLTLLNEDNGFSIVARKVAVTHPLLKEEKDRSPRVDWDKANISAKSTVLTTIQALQDMAEGYLSPYFHWKPTKQGLIPLRPQEESLKEGINRFSELFDYLERLPSYQKLEQGEDILSLRHFSYEKFPGEGNFLFRPVGQIALAQALGVLVFKKGFSLRKIFEKLDHFDQDGGFEGIEFPKSPWYGIIYDGNKKRILVSGRDLAVKLIVYLLGGMNDKLEKAYLREAVAKARTFESRAMGFEGKFVHPKDVGLPDPLM